MIDWLIDKLIDWLMMNWLTDWSIINFKKQGSKLTLANLQNESYFHW